MSFTYLTSLWTDLAAIHFYYNIIDFIFLSLTLSFSVLISNAFPCYAVFHTLINFIEIKIMVKSGQLVS